MKPVRALAPLCLAIIAGITLSLTGIASARSIASPRDAEARPRVVEYHSENVLHSGDQMQGLAKAFSDTFNIYGGRRPDGTHSRLPEGQFQSAFLAPDAQGWFGVDRTANPPHWHASTFNAASLTPLADNHAMFSGVEAGTPGFVSAPGYGNNFNDVLLWEGTTNPSLFTQVRLRFDFHHDTEPAYDFFLVEIDSAGSWNSLASFDGSNRDTTGTFVPAHFDQTILFTPLMYTGPQHASVRLRLRVVSDSAWSDEDGLFPSSGAAQVDNIQVSFNGNLVTNQGDDGVATFETGGQGLDDEGWSPSSAVFAGDFAKVIPQLRDIDPCRQDLTPQLAFIDDGTPPSNSSVSTGGTTSTTWSYGVPGGWVVNYNGGVSYGAVGLNNEYWSPEIAWDDTTTTEEDGLVAGAFVRFSLWQHLPFENGMFWVWSVRSETGGEWSAWRDRNYVYYGGGVPNFINTQFDVTDLLVPNPTHVQIALGVIDLAESAEVPGIDATPSPTFDNVSFWRYDRGGPAISAEQINLFQDSFPNSGSIDALTDPSALSVRIDIAQDVSTGTYNVAGDSMVMDISPTIPGSALDGMPVMKWVLEANPLFDGVRSIPAGAVDEGAGPGGWTRWTGTVTGDSARTSTGEAVLGKFFFDAPNDGPPNPHAPAQSVEPAMFFPGDRFRYFVQAVDDLGNMSTLPSDTTGFLGASTYNRIFEVRALPTITDDGAGGTRQPNVLMINDFGHRGGESAFLNAFAQNGMVEHEDFDVYTVLAPSSFLGNGIGSAGVHGANATQLRDYGILMYDAGDLSSDLLSDGSNVNGHDKGADLETLNQWHNLAGDRYAVYFGDDLCSFLQGGGATSSAYLSNVLSVDLQDDDARDENGGQAVSRVQPTGVLGGYFAQEFVAYGGCLGINHFDSIAPQGTAVKSHEFLSNLDGTPFVPSAGVWYGRTQDVGGTLYDRVDLTFPFGFSYIINSTGKSEVATSANTHLLAEILNAFGQGVNPGGAVAAPAADARLQLMQNLPNPFNPSTTIRFVAPKRGEVGVRIYNLRGELVRVLLKDVVDEGVHDLLWNGKDSAGKSVASGVYICQVEGFGQRLHQKMALMK